MSTRKLILTALICGLVIMLAGGIKLFQVAQDKVTVEVLRLGTSQTLSEMTVTVSAVEQLPDETLVTVSMVGVQGADAFEGWRLLAGGEVLAPETNVERCSPVSATQSTQCVVTFPPSSGSVTVAYLRAGAQSQWAP
jgi:hypothetical protein